MTEQAIRVLLVEDNPDVATTMQTLLVDASPVGEDRAEGPAAFEVHWRDSLSSAIQRLAAGDIDVVLLDLSLPDSHGLDTFFKAHAASPHVPKIVLSVTDDDALAVTAVRAGAQDYLVKGQVTGTLLARAIRHAVERQRPQAVVRPRNRELTLLNRASQALISSLDLDQVLLTFLEETRSLLSVDICSVWLLDPATGELICRQATGPSADVVCDRRLAPKQGIAGWVASAGQSLIVPDVEADERHHGELNDRLKTKLHSSLSVPLRTTTRVIGVLQAMDTQIDRFDETDLTLLELLAPTAAMSIANAQLYEQARHDSADLKARNEELDAFAHTVAHDLKNPLTAVLTFASLVQEDCADLPSDSETHRHLQMMLQNTRKMGTIIDDLLLLAGAHQMKADVREPLDMETIVAETLQRLTHIIEEHEAKITVPPSWPIAVGYGPWVEEVWVNYLSNAIKYGGRPPQVQLGAQQQKNGTTLFWVLDNGRGLTQEEQGRLFTPFTRLDQVRTTGHGLGLSIARRIVEKMGGQVGVESKVGQGSVFYFALPQHRD